MDRTVHGAGGRCDPAETALLSPTPPRPPRPYVAVAVDPFGPGRLMFGSDWPVCLPAASYREVQDALTEALPARSAADRAEIFGGTAARAYGLT